MKTYTLRKIYNFGKVVLGLSLVALVLICAMGGVIHNWPEWTAYPLFGLLIAASIIMAHGVVGMDSTIRQKHESDKTRQDIVEEQADWMAKEKFGWDCAKRVADQHMTPEEWEVFYDKLADKEWDSWVRFDAPALPKTRFGKESLETMLGEAI